MACGNGVRAILKVSLVLPLASHRGGTGGQGGQGGPRSLRRTCRGQRSGRGVVPEHVLLGLDALALENDLAATAAPPGSAVRAAPLRCRGDLPNAAAFLRLSTAGVIDAHDEWQVTRRYLSDVSMDELRAVIANKHAAAAVAKQYQIT